MKPNLALGIEGDEDYNSDETMLSSMEDLVFESDLYQDSDDQGRMKMVKTMLSEYQSLAKKWTFENENRLIELMDMDIELE